MLNLKILITFATLFVITLHADDVTTSSDIPLTWSDNGVAVYLNRGYQNYVYRADNNKVLGPRHYPTDAVFNGTQTGIRWQCVEFINRYYGRTYAHLIRNTGGHAYSYFDSASSRGLFAYANGSSIQPQEGDILCFRGNDFGHVAIVRGLNSAQNRLLVLEQNWSINGQREYLISRVNGRWTVAKTGNYVCQGWLRRRVQLPSQRYAAPQDGRVDFSWSGQGAAYGHRIQVSSSRTGWTAAAGFPNPIVNAGLVVTPITAATRPLDFVWTSSFDSRFSNGSNATFRAPRQGETVWWSVRQTVDGQNSSNYLEPIPVTLPAPSPVMSVELANQNYYTIFQGGSISDRSFWIRNTGGGTLNYQLSSSQNWVRFSANNGSLGGDTGQAHDLQFSVSGLSPGTYTATITITPNSGGLSAVQKTINLTVNAVAPPDDYPDNLQDVASGVGRGSSRSGVIGHVGDVDCMFIRIPSNGYYRVYSTGSIDTFIQVYTNTLSFVFQDDDDDEGIGSAYTSGLNFYIYKYFNAGTHRIRINGVGSTTGSYTVYFSE